MAKSYVEHAILRIKDESTRPVRKINAELKKLRDTARSLSRLRVNIDGLDTAERRVRSLRTELARLPRTKSVRVNFSATGDQTLQRTITTLRAQPPIGLRIGLSGDTVALRQLRALNAEMSQLRTNSRVNLGVTGAGGTRTNNTGPRRTTGTHIPSVFGLPLGNISNTPFPGNIPAAFNITAAYLTVRAGEMTVRSAINATVEAQSAETRREAIIRDPELRAQIEALGIEIAKAGNQTTLTRGENIALDLAVTGFRGETLEALGPHISRLESAAIALNPANATQLSTLSNKLGNLAAVTEDSARAQELATGVYRAAIVQGETFNAPSLISAIRIGGVAQTINQDGLIRVAASVDELGRSTGSGLQRLNKIMNIQADQAGAGGGVAKGVVTALIDAGFRDENGPVQPELFSADPLRWVEEVVGAATKARGLDARNTEDRDTISNLLQRMGFQGTSLRLVLNELAAGAEREKALALAPNIEDAQVAAVDDLGFQLRGLARQFESFSSVVLEPMFEYAAPLAASLAGAIQDLALDDSEGAGTRRAVAIGGTVAAAGGTLFAGSKLLGLLSPRTAALGANTSALAANTAALVANTGRAGVGGMNGALNGAPAGKPGGGIPLGKLFIGSMLVSSLIASDLSVEAATERRNTLGEGAENLFGGLLEKMQLAAENTFGGDFVRGQQDAAQAAIEAGGIWGNLLKTLRGGVNVERRTGGEYGMDGGVPLQLPDAPYSFWEKLITPTLAGSTELQPRESLLPPQRVELEMPASPPTWWQELGLTREGSPAGTGMGDLNDYIALAKADNDNRMLAKAENDNLLTSFKTTGFELGKLLTDEGPSQIDLAFGAGAMTLMEAAPALSEAGLAFGPLATQAILDAAPTIGQIIGENARAGIERSNVSTTPTNQSRRTPQLDTGTFGPQ